MRRSRLFFLVVSTIQVVSLAGCGDDEAPPAPPIDAGLDAEGGFVEAGAADVSARPADAAPDVRGDVTVADISVPVDAADAGAGADVGTVTDAGAEADAGIPADSMIGAEGGDAVSDALLLEATSARLAFVRFAALSPDARAVDFCVRTRAAPGRADRPWQGPLVGQQGAPTGLAYPQLTGYIPLSSDAYDIRLIPAGPRATCDDPPLPGTSDYGDAPRLAPGSATTLVLAGHETAGDAQPGLVLRAYQDEQLVPEGQAELRIIHASADAPQVNVGLGTGESFVPLASNLSYLDVSRGPEFDFDGYLQSPPISGQALGVRDTSNRTELLVVQGSSLLPDSITTVFAVGIPGSTTRPLQLLECDDLSASNTIMTYCTRLPAR